MGNKKCNVLNCDYNKEIEKRTLFSVPEIARENWSKISKFEFKKSRLVCEKHFDPADILDLGGYYGTNGHGQVIIDVSIISNCQKFTSKFF